NIIASVRRQTTQDALLLQRFTHALSDLGGIVVESNATVRSNPCGPLMRMQAILERVRAAQRDACHWEEIRCILGPKPRRVARYAAMSVMWLLAAGNGRY